MRKKFLLMTFLTLLFTAMGTSVLRAQVAKVGNTEYATIDEAIAAWTNGTTLTLLADVTLSNVIQLSSTEYHILDLGTYTMTAASGKDAIQYVVNGRSSAGHALDIKADANNPGGITATGGSVVRHTKPLMSAPSKDRPITRFYGGVFNANYVVRQGGTFGAGYTGASAPHFYFYDGEYNGTIYTNRSIVQFHGGVFNGSIQMSVDSSAYGLVAGGTFKNLSNLMGSALNIDKFTIGSAKGVYDKEVYIDDNGNYVIAAAEPAQGIEADVAKTPGTNDYLYYSKVAEEGQLGYTKVEKALNDNNSASDTVTVYADKIDMSEVTNFSGTIVVPEDHIITITNAPANLNVVDEGGNAITPNANGTYTTVEPAGNDFTGYTRTDAIWGEVWGNAYKSFVIKVLDANGNEMGTTSLNNIGGIIDGDVNVTWSLKLDAASNTDEYWDMSWATAPTIDNMPAKVELWVDGVKVSGGNVVLNGPDEIQKIYAAVTEADGKIIAYYTNVQEAIKAAAPSGTVEILSDVTVDEWIMFSETLNIGSGQIITINIDGLTINGNDKTVTIKDIESAGNGNRLFYDATKLNINNWTINYANGVAGGIGLTSGTINKVTIEGGAGVFPGTGNITISECNFKTSGSAIYYEEARDNLVVTGNTFETAAGQYAIYLRGNTTFTDNTVIAGKVNVVSGSPVVTGNDFGTERFKVYNDATATISGNTINNLVFNKTDVPTESTFTNNTLSEEAQAAIDALPALAGEGTEENPYTISNLAQLKAFRDDVNTGNDYEGKYIKVTATEIDLNNEEWTPIGNNTNRFKGYFDGNNKTIKNLKVSGSNRYVGLFGYILGQGMSASITPSVKDLTLENVDVSGDYYVGGLSGQAYTCNITNVTVKGEVSGARYVGGLVGHVYTYFKECHFIGNASCSFDALGGIAGAGDCRAYDCSVIGDITGSNWVGGIVGNGQEGTSAVGCYVKGVVKTSNNYYRGVGGIAGVAGHGYTSSEFKNNYFDGEVYLEDVIVPAMIMGIVNANNNASIKATVEGNSWNTDYYDVNTPVYVVAEISSSDASLEEWITGASEELTKPRNNNLIMLESDLPYVTEEDYVIMPFSEVTEEQVEQALINNAVAKIGETTYTTLQKALDAAVAGTGNVTVEIIKDIDLTNVDWNPVTVSAPGYPLVTIEGNDKTIKGLNDMLFAGTWAGNSGLIINDLTIKESNIVHDENDSAGNIGVGAFIGFPQASATITLNNCHLVNSTVKGGHWTGGLIGMAGGYNGNDGPVFMNLTIEGCSVIGSTITGKGSCGGIIGHGSCAAWTAVNIQTTIVSGNTVTSTGSSTNKAGAVMGTIGAAGQPTTANGVTMTGGAMVAATVSGNTVTSGETAITTIYGRQGTETGMLELNGGTYDNYPIEENVAYAKPAAGLMIEQNEYGTYGLVPDPAYGKVAMIDDTYYATLQEAVTVGGEVKVIADITLTETVIVAAGKTVVLDLNGKTISTSAEETSYAINNLGTLTLKDSSEGKTGKVNARGIYNGYGNGGDNVATAKIIVESGTYNAKGTNGGAAIFNYGIAEINGGTFTSIGGYSLSNQSGSSITVADGVTANNGIYISNGVLTINGGDIDGNRSGCHVVYAWNSTVTINGGDFYNNNSGNATIMAAGTTQMTIKGGIFGIKDGRVPGNANTWTSCLTDTKDEATMIVIGGTFNGGFRVQSGTTMTIEGGSFNDCGGSGYNIYGTATVKGGTFTDNAAITFARNYLADGFKLEENADGTYGVVPFVEKSYEIKENTTLADAIAQAKEDGAEIVTYIIYGAATLETGFSHGIVDFGGEEGYITIKGANVNTRSEDSFTITGGGVPDIKGVTFKDLTFYDEGTYLPTANEFMYQNFIDCTFENVKFEDGIRLSGNCTIKDCEVNANTNDEYAIWLDEGTFEMTGSTVTAGNDAYGLLKSDVVDKITISDNTFQYLAKVNKEALNVKGATIVATDNTFIDCAKGIVPADKVNYTADGTTQITDAIIAVDNEIIIYVAKIGDVKYQSLAEAATAAQDGETIQLLWAEGHAPIAMAATIVNNKTVTITGTADVDWDKGWLYVGRNGEGNGKLIFNEANLTSKSVDTGTNGTGLNVSCKKVKEGEYTTNDGEVEIIDSNIQLDYLIGKGNIKLDNSTLNVYEGFAVGARPASETGGVQRTVTMDITNGSKVIVKNHNGQGLGYESKGIMNIDATSTFETTQSFLVTADGTMNVNGGNVKTVGTLTNNGTINVTGESTLNIEKLEGSSIDLNEGAIVKNSTVGGDAYIAGNVIFRGDNTFNMITDYGDYYSQVTPSMWTVEAGASLTLTKTDRYGLGYGDKVTVYGEIEDEQALTARASLTDEDASVNMYGGLVGMTNSAAPNAENSFTATNAYLIFGVNGDKSFGNKPGNYYGNYTFTFNNSVVTANGFKFYEDNGTSTVKFSYSDLLVNGVLMTNDASSNFTFENSVVLSMATSNGTDDKNQNAGVMTLTNTQFTYRAAFTNVGNLNIGENSTFTAPSVVNNGTINFTALSAKLDTDTEGLTIVDKVNNPDYAIAYLDGIYQYAKYVAQIGDDKYLTLQEAIDEVAEDETIVLLGDITFTTGANGSTNGISYTRGVNFTLDLSGKTITSDLGGNALRFKIGDGNDVTNTEVTINVKNGKIVSGSNNWCAISAATADNSGNNLILNLTDLEVEANKAGDFAIKSWAGAVVHTNNVDVISSYAGGFYACGGEIVLDENSSVNQEGLHTQPYMSYAFGVSSNGKMTINGGTYSAVPAAATDAGNQGTSHGSAVGGVMSSGGTLIINGGTFSNDNFGDNSLATAARYLIYADAKGDLQINGGTFNALKGIIDNTTNTGADVATVTLKGGTYSANPKPIYNGDAAIPAGYSVVDNEDGTYSVVEDQVAKIGDVTYKLLQEAIDEVAEGETIVLIDNIEQADGVIITDKKNIIIDLNGKTFTVTEGASTNNRNFKINGASVVTIKNGTMIAAGDYSSGAYGTVRTEGTAKVTLTGLKLYNYRGNGLNIKALGGTTVEIDSTEIYSEYGGGIEAAGGTITLAETVKVEQKGMYTAPYNSMAISVNGEGLVTVNGGTYSTECITAEEANGQGTSHGPWVVGVLNSGGTLIINGGTFSNDNFGDNSLATAARGAVLADTKANVQINGGTFNALAKIIDIQNNLGDADNNPVVTLKGGIYSADPTKDNAGNISNCIVLAWGYSVKPLDNGTYTVIQIAGTQTREFAYPGWYWFSTYIDFESGEEGLDELQEQLDDNAATIKGQTAFTNYQYYNGVPFWTSALTSISASEMYMIKTTNKFDEEEQTYENVSVSLEGDFVDYESYEITIHNGWNWIGYPLNTEVSMTEALAGFTPAEGDMIKGKTQGSSSSYNTTLFGGWYPDFNMIPGEGYMYYSAASENKTLTYRAGNGGTQNAKTSVEDNHWIVDEYKYSNNMTVIAMLSIDGEIVKGNYEVAAFANGECRGSARPIYIESIDTYVLFMTIHGDEVEELTFMYYDIDKDTEYELSNVMNYSNDAIVGTIDNPYIFSMNILGIGENSIDNINIYPNPTTTDREINLQAICDKVEVFNALGVKVAEYHNVDTLDALETAGIYVIRITNDNAVKHCRLVVK